MSEAFQSLLKELLHTVGSRRREALLNFEAESSEESIAHFRFFARSLSPATAIDLCNTLANATSHELVGLLGDYAISRTPMLRDQALHSLDHIGGPLRLPVLKRLLEHDDPATVARACTLIGTSGDPKAAIWLIPRLKDSASTVVINALRALDLLSYAKVVEHLPRLLNHQIGDVRIQAVDTLQALAPIEELPLPALIRQLTIDEDPKVRGRCAMTIAPAQHDEVRKALIKTLASDASGEVRSTSARALITHPSGDAVAQLLTSAATDSDADVAMHCQRSLDAMDEHPVLEKCRAFMRTEDPRIRRETAAVMGALSLEDSHQLLALTLDLETEPSVRRAIIDALGRSRWIMAWDTLCALFDDNPEDRSAILGALGDLLAPETLSEYAAYLLRVESDNEQLVILQKLEYFHRGALLPDPVAAELPPYLSHQNPTLRHSALRLALRCRYPGLVQVLNRMITSENARDSKAAAAALFAQFNDNPLALCLELLTTGSLSTLARAIGLRDNLGPTGRNLCWYLAELHHDTVPHAMEALRAAAEVDTDALVSAIVTSDGISTEALVRAWLALSPEAQARGGLDLEGLFAKAPQTVRLGIMNAMGSTHADEYLPQLVDLAMRDLDYAVRDRARNIIRDLVNGPVVSNA